MQWTSIVREAGPERINVLELDPAVVHGVLSNDRIAGRERVSAMARRVGAVAGVNGGYFGPSGDPVGVLAIDGAAAERARRRAQRAARGRGRGHGRAACASGARSPINGVTRLIDGLDRTRGLVPACGGRGGDLPTSAAERRAHLHRRERARAALAELRGAPAARGRGGGGAARRDRGEGSRPGHGAGAARRAAAHRHRRRRPLPAQRGAAAQPRRGRADAHRRGTTARPRAADARGGRRPAAACAAGAWP